MSNDALHVHEHGSPEAPPLVLLHGITDDGSNWPDAVERWSGAWHVFGVDQRGHGFSPRFSPDQMSRMSDVLVADLIGLLEGLPGPVAAVGHSLGGRVAALAAVRRPELFSCLVLEDPAVVDRVILTPGPNTEWLEGVTAVSEHPETELARMREETPWSETELTAWAASKPRVDRWMLRRGTIDSLDVAEVFNALRVPTLVLWDADGDLRCDPGILDNDLVRFEYLDQVGHCIRRDDPELFHGLVDPWLDAHRPGART
ncbi:alpha/beta hydrolase [Arachnia propionica]|uniref:Alpha/beta hydrolase n=1 Tax=Arachnia propionica TaxID=1750 RepID=A0A3P1T7I5_9ACTN|nr:alpha/beta hydrolase [Arachnia propionica]MDO5082660.1 alpha/beta hydrolase [Arachnia propionica]RRD05145.1 alpha/beta hydrolase [Arachnia propionica]